MFIRNKLRTNNKISIQIVESIRNGTKISQKIIENIGSVDLDDKKRLLALKKIAEERLLEIKKDRFNAGEISTYGRKKKKQVEDIMPVSNVCLSDITEEHQISDGLDTIVELVYQSFGFNKLLSNATNKVIKRLIITRMASTYKEEKLWQFIYPNLQYSIKTNRLNNVLYKLHTQINKIHQLISATCQKLIPKNDKIYITIRRLNFSTINGNGMGRLDDEDNFIINTSNYVLIFLSNEFGLPIDYRVVEGNNIKLDELTETLNEWKKMFRPNEFCFIGDKSIFSKNNLNFLEKQKYNYIITAKLRKLPNFILNEITDESRYTAISIKKNITWISESIIDEQKKLITTYTIKQIKKDIYKRTKNQPHMPFKNLFNNLNQATEAKTTEHEDILDGMRGIVTNMNMLNAKEIIVKHQELINLTDVFKADGLEFTQSLNNSNESIETHLLLSFMAYSIAKYIQFRVELLQNEYSKEDVIGVLLGVRSTIYSRTTNGDKYCVPNKLSPNASMIYKAFNVQRNTHATIYLT